MMGVDEEYKRTDIDTVKEQMRKYLDQINVLNPQGHIKSVREY